METPFKDVSWIKQMISRQLVEVSKLSGADNVIRATCCRIFPGRRKKNLKKKSETSLKIEHFAADFSCVSPG